MQKPKPAAISEGFFVVAPGTVVGLIPWLITRWQFRRPLPGRMVMRVVGALLIVAVLVPPVSAFIEFVKAGGTPIPVAPAFRPLV
jgi:hypothetical protein